LDEIANISLIGSGNVANQLAFTFQQEGVNVSHIYSRNNITGSALASKFNAVFLENIESLPKQLCIVCVPDDVVTSVINSIDKNIPVAYTSGSVELASFNSRKNTGVFYPLQTFSLERIIDFFEVPIFIESDNEYFTSTLFNLAWKISKDVNQANSEERKKMHIAAVMVNNFTNHIIHLAQQYSSENNIDFKHLQPLLKETVLKLEKTLAISAQTGPARRSDLAVIESHLQKLTGKTREVYKVISESIIETYAKNDKL